MKNNQKRQPDDDYSVDQVNQRSFEDFDHFDYNPNMEVSFLGDDDDEISDYVMMDYSDDLD
jgi:hypothetical protein